MVTTVEQLLAAGRKRGRGPEKGTEIIHVFLRLPPASFKGQLQPVKNSLTLLHWGQYPDAVPGGRPRRTSTPDEAADAVARKAVDELVAAAVRRRRAARSNVSATPSGHLLLAVTAARLSAAAERLALAEVARAREAEGLTWEQVGEAFGTTRQSAHERFRA